MHQMQYAQNSNLPFILMDVFKFLNSDLEFIISGNAVVCGVMYSICTRNMLAPRHLVDHSYGAVDETVSV